MTTTDKLPTDVNRGLLSDLARKLDAIDILEWIEVSAANLATLGHRGSWIELTPELVQIAGIDRIDYSPRSLGAASLHVAGPRLASIEVHKFQPLEDQRFWIAHEIGHLLWRQADDFRIRLSRYEDTLGSDLTIEWLCNRFAAALLLPQPLVRQSLADVGMLKNGLVDFTRVGLIPFLARKHKVPQRMLARRIWHEFGNRIDAILCIRLAAGPRDNSPTWRVQWDALPRKSLRKSRRLYGRRIPSELLPAAIPYTGVLDHRWERLVMDAMENRPGRAIASMKADSKHSQGSISNDTSLRDNDRLFVAIDLSCVSTSGTL